jgi:hypothetical protein
MQAHAGEITAAPCMCQKSIEPEIGAAAGHVHTMENGIKSLKIYTDPKVHLLEK